MSSCFRSWSCSGSNVPKPKQVDQQQQQQPQLTLTANGAGPPPGDFRRQFEARLNNSWRTALFIKWYAVLINVVEACFAIYEIAKRDRQQRQEGRSRMNLHTAMATLMLLSNGAAIVGLFTANSALLAPYYYLHVATLVLELNYVVTRVATAGWNTAGRKSTPSTLRSLATLAYITFNLLIMIGAEFSTDRGDGHDGWSSGMFSGPHWMGSLWT